MSEFGFGFCLSPQALLRVTCHFHLGGFWRSLCLEEESSGGSKKDENRKSFNSFDLYHENLCASASIFRATLGRIPSFGETPAAAVCKFVMFSFSSTHPRHGDGCSRIIHGPGLSRTEWTGTSNIEATRFFLAIQPASPLAQLKRQGAGQMMEQQQQQQQS